MVAFLYEGKLGNLTKISPGSSRYGVIISVHRRIGKFEHVRMDGRVCRRDQPWTVHLALDYNLMVFPKRSILLFETAKRSRTEDEELRNSEEAGACLEQHGRICGKRTRRVSRTGIKLGGRERPQVCGL